LIDARTFKNQLMRNFQLSLSPKELGALIDEIEGQEGEEGI